MNACPAVLIALVATAAACVSLPAKNSNVFADPSERSSAIDAKGVTHNEPMPPGKMPPWIRDCIKLVGPEYPYEARARRYTGSGRFRLYLDLKTGEVTQRH